MKKAQKLHKTDMYKYIAALVLLLWLFPSLIWAQDTDTTRQELDFEQEQQNLLLQERSLSGGVMTEMGTYQIPNETQYYKRPFKGQEYLDEAVEAYRREIENRMGESWYWQFLKTVSPFIRLELGAFQTLEMQFVDRDNPLFRSYNSDEKIE